MFCLGGTTVRLFLGGTIKSSESNRSVWSLLSTSLSLHSPLSLFRSLSFSLALSSTSTWLCLVFKRRGGNEKCPEASSTETSRGGISQLLRRGRLGGTVKEMEGSSVGWFNVVARCCCNTSQGGASSSYIETSFLSKVKFSPRLWFAGDLASKKRMWSSFVSSCHTIRARTFFRLEVFEDRNAERISLWG